MPRSTGFPAMDAADDFQRLRRRQVLSRLAQRLLREPDDVSLILPFDEVVAALGMLGERQIGLVTIPCRLHRRQRGPAGRLRSPLPPGVGPATGTLGAGRHSQRRGQPMPPI